MFLSIFFHRLLGVVFLCLILSVSAEAQLKKGDYHVDFRSSIFYASQTKKPSFNLYITYLKMAGNRFMVGGGLSFERNNLNFSGFGVSSFTNVQVRQISRYYIATGRLAPFLSLEHIFQVSKTDGNNQNFFGYQLSPGIGLTYFLRPNIALEGLLASNLLNMRDFDSDQQFLNFNLGLKLFFNDKFFRKGEALPERILKKGNIVSSTRLNFNKELSGDKFSQLISAPNIRYFLTDRLNIFAGYFRQRFKNSSIGNAGTRNLLDLSLGAAYYIGLSDKLFWNFDVSNTIRMGGGKFSDMIDNGVSVITTQASTSLQYFTGPTKFYGGFGYYTASLDGFGNSGGEFEQVASDYDIFAGVDYFISDYIYLNTDLRYTSFGSFNFRGVGKTIRLGFGIGFIIGKRGEEETSIN